VKIEHRWTRSAGDHIVTRSPDGSLLAVSDPDGSSIDLVDAASLAFVGRLTADMFGIHCLAFRRDGRALAAGSGHYSEEEFRTYGPNGCCVHIWNVGERRLVERVDMPAPVRGLRYEDDGRLAAWCDAAPDAEMRWSGHLTSRGRVAARLGPAPSIEHEGGLRLRLGMPRRQDDHRPGGASALTSDGASVVSGFNDGSIDVTRCVDRVVTAWRPAHAGPVTSLVTLGGDVFMTASREDNRAKVWGKDLAPLLDEACDCPELLGTNPDGGIYVRSERYQDETHRFAYEEWRIVDGRVQRRPILAGPWHVVSPDGAFAAGGALSNVLSFGPLNEGPSAIVSTRDKPSGRSPDGFDFRYFAFSTDGTHLAVGGNNAKIAVWSTRPALSECPDRTLDPGGELHSLAFHPDGVTLAASLYGRVALLGEHGAFATVAIRKNCIGKLAFSEDGRRLLVVARESIQLYDVSM
jgi:hypothetical protein